MIPDRCVVAVCKQCGGLAGALTLEQRKEGYAAAMCPECSSDKLVYVRYQLVARAVETYRAPRRPKAKASPP